MDPELPSFPRPTFPPPTSLEKPTTPPQKEIIRELITKEIVPQALVDELSSQRHVLQKLQATQQEHLERAIERVSSKANQDSKWEMQQWKEEATAAKAALAQAQAQLHQQQQTMQLPLRPLEIRQESKRQSKVVHVQATSSVASAPSQTEPSVSKHASVGVEPPRVRGVATMVEPTLVSVSTNLSGLTEHRSMATNTVASYQQNRPSEPPKEEPSPTLPEPATLRRFSFTSVNQKMTRRDTFASEGLLIVTAERVEKYRRTKTPDQPDVRVVENTVLGSVSPFDLVENPLVDDSNPQPGDVTIRQVMGRLAHECIGEWVNTHPEHLQSQERNAEQPAKDLFEQDDVELLVKEFVEQELSRKRESTQVCGDEEQLAMLLRDYIQQQCDHPEPARGNTPIDPERGNNLDLEHTTVVRDSPTHIGPFPTSTRSKVKEFRDASNSPEPMALDKPVSPKQNSIGCATDELPGVDAATFALERCATDATTQEPSRIISNIERSRPRPRKVRSAASQFDRYQKLLLRLCHHVLQANDASAKPKTVSKTTGTEPDLIREEHAEVPPLPSPETTPGPHQALSEVSRSTETSDQQVQRTRGSNLTHIAKEPTTGTSIAGSTSGDVSSKTSDTSICIRLEGSNQPTTLQPATLLRAPVIPRHMVEAPVSPLKQPESRTPVRGDLVAQLIAEWFNNQMHTPAMPPLTIHGVAIQSPQSPQQTATSGLSVSNISSTNPSSVEASAVAEGRFVVLKKAQLAAYHTAARPTSRHSDDTSSLRTSRTSDAAELPSWPLRAGQVRPQFPQIPQSDVPNVQVWDTRDGERIEVSCLPGNQFEPLDLEIRGHP